MTREQAMREAALAHYADPERQGISRIATAGADAERARVVAWLRQGPAGSAGLWGRIKLCWWMLTSERAFAAGLLACIADALETRAHWQEDKRD